MLKQIIHHFQHPLIKLEKQRNEINIDPDWPEGLKAVLTSPIADAQTLLNDQPMLALDFETTGVKALHNGILSIGSIRMSMSKIDLSTAMHCFISNSCQVKAESAAINHIVPNMLCDGLSLDEAMNRLFLKMAGRIGLVHGAIIEESFINQYVQERFGLPQLPYIWIDTLKIEKELTFKSTDKGFNSLQLNEVRHRYRLPNYQAHSALVDALSSAELLLAQTKRIFGQKAITLADIYL